jgi:hypothetical protein
MLLVRSILIQFYYQLHDCRSNYEHNLKYNDKNVYVGLYMKIKKDHK